MSFLLGSKLKVMVATSWGSLTVKILDQLLRNSGFWVGVVKVICGHYTRIVKALI